MPSHPDLLIVEDNPLILKSLLAFLAPLRLRILTATNGDEAMQVLNGVPVLGALVTDIRMPGEVNGVGLALEARRRFPGLPILLMTGFASTADLDLARAPGCRLVMKPFRAKTLVGHVVDMLGRGEPAQRCA
jgi:CheY-like chemotaxis protein